MLWQPGTVPDCGISAAACPLSSCTVLRWSALLCCQRRLGFAASPLSHALHASSCRRTPAVACPVE